MRSYKDKTILVIDDDTNVLRNIEIQLKKENLEIDFENNPIMALNLINKKEFDIIICDIKMKPIDGFDLLKRVKKIRPGIKVIIISGYFDDEIKQKARALGSNDFIAKPIRRNRLISAINKVPRIY
ncbi:MAG: response regulator [Spirochaetes bacterium]|nr:response regulator [Spirochaetota bacterium]